MTTKNKEKEISEENQKLVKQLDERGYDWNKHPKVQGIIKDNQKEREARQSAEQDLERLREENELLMSQLKDHKPEKPSETDKDLEGLPKDPDDYITVKQAKALAEKAKQENQQKNQQETQKQMQRRLLDSEKKAIEKYSEEKMGEGLDYSTVIEEGYKKLIKNNPAYKQVVLNADDPAEEAYRLGCQNPVIQKRLEKKRNQELLNKMEERPSSQTKVGSITDTQYNELLKLSDEELNRKIEERGGQ